MKSLAAFLGLLFICQGIEAFGNDDFGELFAKIGEKCQEKLGTPEASIAKLIDGEFDKGGADRDIKCFINCMAEDFKSSDADTQRDVKSMLNEEAAEECHHKTDEDPCENAYKTFMCVKENTAKIFKPQ